MKVSHEPFHCTECYSEFQKEDSSRLAVVQRYTGDNCWRSFALAYRRKTNEILQNPPESNEISLKSGDPGHMIFFVSSSQHTVWQFRTQHMAREFRAHDPVRTQGAGLIIVTASLLEFLYNHLITFQTTREVRSR